MLSGVKYMRRFNKYVTGNLAELLNKLEGRSPDYIGTESNCYRFKKYVIIERRSERRDGKNFELRTKLAQRLGGNIARVFERMDNYYFMERASGKPLFDISSIKADNLPIFKRLADAPQEQYDAVVKSVIINTIVGIDMDFSPQNIIFDEKKGLTPVDLEESGKIPNFMTFKIRMQTFRSLTSSQAEGVEKTGMLAKKIEAKFERAVNKYLSDAQIEKYIVCAKMIDNAIKHREKLKYAMEFTKQAINTSERSMSVPKQTQQIAR